MPSVDKRGHPPDEAALGETLGTATRSWRALLRFLRGRAPGHRCEWKHYGQKYGWQLKVTYEKRALLYLVPRHGSFLAALAMNDEAVAALASQNIPATLLRQIESAKAYPEGRPARVEVTGPQDVALVERLLAAKLDSGARTRRPLQFKG